MATRWLVIFRPDRLKTQDLEHLESSLPRFAAQGLSIRDPDEVFTLLDADRSAACPNF